MYGEDADHVKELGGSALPNVGYYQALFFPPQVEIDFRGLQYIFSPRGAVKTWETSQQVEDAPQR